MKKSELIAQIRAKGSYLCVGLDVEMDKIPAHIRTGKDPIFEFNRRMIDATADHCVAYKPNIAFYEALGTYGWEALERTLAYIPETHFSIADAKRGDIGNTSRLYAHTFFRTYQFDSITVAPYMGRDSVEPFLGFDGKWAIVLGLTSNAGNADFQMLQPDGKPLYEHVIRKVASWGTDENMMFVVGATQPEQLGEIRAMLPDYFFLVPGVGAQGGSLEEVSKYGLNDDCGLLVNSSRGILYASKGEDFAEAAKAEAAAIHANMRALLGA